MIDATQEGPFNANGTIGFSANTSSYNKE